VQWTPRPSETWGAAGAAVIAAAVAATLDPAGELLLGLAAALLAGIAGTDLLLRPRLRADASGIEVRTLAVRRALPWAEVSGVRVDERSRYGRAARTLEVDAGDTLVLLGRRALGADPREVADALAAIRTGRTPLPPGSYDEDPEAYDPDEEA
jgi:Bacterial PH domain